MGNRRRRRTADRDTVPAASRCDCCRPLGLCGLPPVMYLGDLSRSSYPACGSVDSRHTGACLAAARPPVDRAWTTASRCPHPDHRHGSYPPAPQALPLLVDKVLNGAKPMRRTAPPARSARPVRTSIPGVIAKRCTLVTESPVTPRLAVTIEPIVHWWLQARLRAIKQPSTNARATKGSGQSRSRPV